MHDGHRALLRRCGRKHAHMDTSLDANDQTPLRQIGAPIGANLACRTTAWYWWGRRTKERREGEEIDHRSNAYAAPPLGTASPIGYDQGDVASLRPLNPNDKTNIIKEPKGAGSIGARNKVR